MKKALLIGIFSLLVPAPFRGVQAQAVSNTTIKAVEKASETREPSTTAANANRATPAVSPANEKPSATAHESTSVPTRFLASDQPPPPGRAAKGDSGSGNTASAEESRLTEIYTIGVGDILDIRLINSPSTRSTLYSVIEGGLIDLPIVGGPISVVGLTTKDIQARITTQLKRLAVEDRTQVAVGVRQYGSHAVIITDCRQSSTKFYDAKQYPCVTRGSSVRLTPRRAAQCAPRSTQIVVDICAQLSGSPRR